MRNVLILLLAVSSVSWSCGKKKMTLAEKVEKKNISIADVFKEAQRLMFKRKYVEARQWYRIIETQAPDSPFFADIKLGIADSYFFDRASTYIEASVEYKSFMLHFPNHPKSDYAQYQYAMCFFTEIENADRDQTSTFTAYTEFKNLLDRFPGSPYADKAREKMDLCLLRLADHEFTVGYYYFRRGRGFEISAESRFKYIVDNYEGQFDPLKTYFHLAETLWRLERYKEAQKYYEYLNENFPDSDYQPFVEDKLARFAKIQETGYDPGQETDEAPADEKDDPIGH
ncbi:MAG: outer membrane protein assembly factor BamD [Acidobacteria bacterium]|nr:outer membrane protein assembly factor BamD [Acidobacteriota bacterium]